MESQNNNTDDKKSKDLNLEVPKEKTDEQVTKNGGDKDGDSAANVLPTVYKEVGIVKTNGKPIDRPGPSLHQMWAKQNVKEERCVEKETLALLKSQTKYFMDENSRAAEKFNIKLRRFQLTDILPELDVAEKKQLIEE